MDNVNQYLNVVGARKEAKRNQKSDSKKAD